MYQKIENRYESDDETRGKEKVIRLDEVIIAPAEDNPDTLGSNPEKEPPRFLYERILNCLNFLNNQKKVIVNIPDIKNKVSDERIFKKLLPLNLITSWVSVFGAYPTLKYLDNYLFRSLLLQIAKLNKELLTKTNFLAELMTNLNWQAKNIDIDHNECDNCWDHLVYEYRSSLTWWTPDCLNIVREDLPDIKLQCDRGICYFANSTEEICSYVKQLNIEFSNDLCNFYKNRLCFWFDQGKVITSLQAEIASLNQHIASLDVHNPIIWGITSTFAVGATLATAYYGYSYYKNHQNLNKAIIEVSKLDFNENNKHIDELMDVCKKLKIELSQDIDKLIEQLKEHAEIFSKRREGRIAAFKFFTQNKFPSDVSLNIIGYTDLAPALTG